MLFITLNISFYVNIHVDASTDVIMPPEASMYEYKLLLFKYFCMVSVYVRLCRQNTKNDWMNEFALDQLNYSLR